MKSTRRQHRIKKSKWKSLGFILRLLLIVLIPILGLVFIKLNTKYWNGRDKISVVSQKSSGDVEVVMVDPKLEEVVTFKIPGDTEVTVARNLGTLRLKNVWQLGVNEGLKGDLLAQTVTRDFLFPVTLYRGPNGETNIPFGDRILLKLFDIRTKNLDRTEIDLGKGQYLKKGKLSDGEVGYIVSGAVSDRLTVYFADDDFISKNVRVYIKDATGTFESAQKVGKIIEVMGGKVVTIEKLSAEESDCMVLGKDKKLVSKITRLFDCTKGSGLTDFDLEIRLGKDFAKRF